MPIVRILLVVFGIALALFGVADLILPHARFVSSDPQPLAVLAEPPKFVTVNFSNRIAPESTLEVTWTIRFSPSGNIEYLKGDSVIIKSEIDPSDASGKSMRAQLPPGHKGLYWINWRTTTAGWRTVTYGKTAFGVGMGVPANLVSDFNGATWERTYDRRGRRSAIVGGVLMIALALVIRRNSNTRLGA